MPRLRSSAPAGASCETPGQRSCTKCGGTKPLDRFYLRSASDPHGPRRARCKDCESAYSAEYHRNGPPLDRRVQRELIEHGFDNPDALSPEVRDEVFTDEPIDPEVLAKYQAMQKASAVKEQRRQRELVKTAHIRNQYTMRSAL